MPPPPATHNDVFLARLSYSTVRFIIITLCVLSLTGPILVIIGVGILKTPDSFDARIDRYNALIRNFTKNDGPILLQAEAKLYQYAQENTTTPLRTITVEPLFPNPTSKPFSASPQLPHGNELIDSSARSVPLESNASSTAIRRDLWSETYSVAASSSSSEQFPATILNITNSITGKVSSIPLPPLLQTETVTAPSTLCIPHQGDKTCTRQRMKDLCAKESKCANAQYNGPSCTSGKGCRGCSWTRYQTTVCVPISLSLETGEFSPSLKMKSCFYPFTTVDGEHGSNSVSMIASSDNNNNNNNENGNTENDQRRILQITSCAAKNVTSSSTAYDDDTNSRNNLPLKIVLMLDTDPFFVAQNMTRGTNIFNGLPGQVERDVGLGFTIGGSCLIFVTVVAWLSLNAMVNKDERTARHFYRAFGQLYIPSTNDYVDAIAKGMSYKHSNGFVPNRSKNVEGKMYEAPLADVLMKSEDTTTSTSRRDSSVVEETRNHKTFAPPRVLLQETDE